MATHSSVLWSTDRGAWRATAHGVAESRTRLRTKPSVQHRSPEFRQEGHRVWLQKRSWRAQALPLVENREIIADLTTGPPGASLRAQKIKNLQETWVPSLGREDSPGEGNGSPLQ